MSLSKDAGDATSIIPRGFRLNYCLAQFNYVLESRLEIYYFPRTFDLTKAKSRNALTRAPSIVIDPKGTSGVGIGGEELDPQPQGSLEVLELVLEVVEVVLVVLVVGIISGEVLKAVFFRPRPFVALGSEITVPPGVPLVTDSSFPSGHAIIVSIGASFMLWKLFPGSVRAKAVSLLLTLEAAIVCSTCRGYFSSKYKLANHGRVLIERICQNIF
jgi:hypothetical protein